MRHKLLFLIVFVTVSTAFALAGPYTHFATLSGNQEVPQNATTGLGTARCELVGDDLYYTITFGGLSAPVTAGHFHTGAVGVSGGVVVGLQNLSATGAFGVWNDLTPAQIAQLNAHGFYINIHTSALPGGEIRGQVLTRGTCIAHLAGSNEVPPNGSAARGFGWFRLDANEDTLQYAIAWSALGSTMTAAHIHRGVAGVAGPVVHGLQNLVPGSAGGNWGPITAQNVIQLEAESLYVNVHSQVFPGGEIRGQIICICMPEDANFNALTDAGTSQCIALCPDQSSRIRVTNIPDGLFPIVTKRLGCTTPCNFDCDPATYIQEFFGGNWQYTNGVFWLEIRGDGCICVTLDDILPVELNDFDAIAGDGIVTVNWRTASESNLNRFEILRDGQTMAQVSANNAASGAEYSWVDNNVNNGTTYSYTLVVVNADGSRETLVTESATPQENMVVNSFALYQNYPNPFNPQTNITFDLDEASLVNLKVFNVAGQEIAVIANGNYASGRHVVSFDATGMASGVYLYRLEANGHAAQQKMVLIK